MTPEEIKALITATLNEQLPSVLKTTMTEFSGHFEQQLNEFASTLGSREPEVSQAPEISAADANDPVARRLAVLEAELKKERDERAKERLQAEELNFSNSLKDQLAAKGNVLHQGLVSKLLGYELRNGAKQKDGEWLTKDGLKLNEAIDHFFSTPEGMHFLPSDHQNGTATPASRVPSVSLRVVYLR
jgi:hypothetical protein